MRTLLLLVAISAVAFGATGCRLGAAAPGYRPDISKKPKPRAEEKPVQLVEAEPKPDDPIIYIFIAG
ncbi:MAG: hypothetical protein L3J82_06410 [Planctomycetes bacterium]|nr:hypothetical protein [Planctomycetota bacterium]